MSDCNVYRTVIETGNDDVKISIKNVDKYTAKVKVILRMIYVKKELV